MGRCPDVGRAGDRVPAATHAGSVLESSAIPISPPFPDGSHTPAHQSTVQDAATDRCTVRGSSARSDKQAVRMGAPKGCFDDSRAVPPDRPGGGRDRRRPRHRRASAIALAEAGADVVISARTEADSTVWPSRSKRSVGAPRWSPATSPTSSRGLTGTAGEGALRSPRRRGQQPRWHHAAPLLDTTPSTWKRRSTSTCHRPCAGARGRAAAPRGRRRVDRQHLLGDGADTGRGFLAYGTAKAASPLHPPRGEGPRPRIRINAIAVGSTATSALDIVLQSDELREQMEAATPSAHRRRRGHRSRRALLASAAGGYLTGRSWKSTGAPTPDPGIRPADL